MNYTYLIIILLFLAIAYMLYSGCPVDMDMDKNKTQKENFTSKYTANDHIYLGHRRDPYNLLDDSLFTNVIAYNNDDDPYECGGKLGIEKCLENCKGQCVEFGVTGIGYCFAPDKADLKAQEIFEKSEPKQIII